jgi:hypothetical protein
MICFFDFYSLPLRIRDLSDFFVQMLASIWGVSRLDPIIGVMSGPPEIGKFSSLRKECSDILVVLA